MSPKKQSLQDQINTLNNDLLRVSSENKNLQTSIESLTEQNKILKTLNLH
jgi:hypothetical protein